MEWLTADDLMSSIERRLEATYSLAPHGPSIRDISTRSWESLRVPSWWAAQLFIKKAAEYQQSCLELPGAAPSAARKERESALQWLSAWLNTFCDGTPM